MRTVYLGTSAFAAAVLDRLAASDHRPALVVTRPDRPKGRGRQLQSPPVAIRARELGLDVIQPDRLHDPEPLERIAAAGAEVACVCAYGVLIKEPLLSAYEMLNVHPSLLPRWRGAAPIERAIMAGDAESGVMVMKMDIGLDTGDVAMAERLAITDTMTAADLHDALAPLGADLMVRAMGALARGGLQLQKQSADGVTYAAKIEKAEARIDWQRPAREVLRHIHGLSPFPGAWCEIASEGEPARIKILRCEPASGSGAPGEVLGDGLTIACGDGAIRILELQRAGKAPMKSADFLRGTPLKPPARLG